jgi:hypothetical protein
MDVVAVFPSKVDAWFLAVFWGVGAVCLAGAPFLRKRSVGATALVAAIGALLVFIGFNARSLRYEIHADGSVATAGTVIPSPSVLFRAADVVGVTPSHDARSAPASSLDRLRVDLAGGRAVLVSPEDKAGFTAALAKAAHSSSNGSTGATLGS